MIGSAGSERTSEMKWARYQAICGSLGVYSAAPAEQGRHVALLARDLLGALHVVADAGEALEIGGDIALRLGLRDAVLDRAQIDLGLGLRHVRLLPGVVIVELGDAIGVEAG